MTKNEFFRILEEGLKDFPPQELQDILYDYKEHFSNALSDGKSEEEILNELGDPYIIVNQYRSGYVQPTSYTEESNSKKSKENFSSSNGTSPGNKNNATNNSVNRILKIAIIICLIFLLGPFTLGAGATGLALLVSLISIPFVLSISGFAMMLGKLGFNIAGFGMPPFFADFPNSVIILVTIASIAATILVIILSYYFIKLLVISIKNTINKFLSKGGN